MANIPQYRRVADDLRTQIRSGTLAAGSRLPSLPGLAEQYGVSVDVANKAIGTLRAEGLVETRQGSGSFVRGFTLIPRVSPSRLSKTQWGSGKAIQDLDTGRRWRTVDVVVSEAPAPADVAEALGIATDTTVITRGRRYIVDDRPVQLATSFYLLDMVRGTAITYTDTGPGGSYARLAELGHEPVRFEEIVVARAPHPDEVSALALPKTGSVVFHITRHAFTSVDRCVEVNHMVLDAAAYSLRYHFNA